MYRVLLADDEQIERMALARRLMRRFGDILQISEATNGKEAVQLYEKEHSQIIIMDISMPELNGVEAAGKHWRSMKKRRSRSQYWILKCRELPVLKQRRG